MIRWKSTSLATSSEAQVSEAAAAGTSSSSSSSCHRVKSIGKSCSRSSTSWIRRYSSVLAIIVIFNVMQVSYCLGGVFELRLREFSNPSGRDMDGNCCVHHHNHQQRSGSSSIIISGSGSSNSGSAIPTTSSTSSDSLSNSNDVCGGLCLTKFRVCVKHYQVTIDHNPPCTFGEASTTDLYGDKAINQEFKFPFNFRWPGTFSLIIEAWHHNSPAVPPVASSSGSSNRKNNDTLVNRPRLVSRMGIQQYLDVGDEWRPREWTGNEGQVSLSYEYRVTCLPDYYGDACDKTCRARNDTFGHYTCSDQGDKICLPGWSGSYCEKPICRPGCQGTCVVPDTCQCHSGWEGQYCTECVRYPGCKHGTCSNPWECSCQEGWGGLFCNQDLNYCTNHKPCRNGGTCFNTGQGSYTCACPVGFIGADCETRADGCTCLNGGTCRENGTATFCVCPPGWSGVNCEIASFSCDSIVNPCANGGSCTEEMSSGLATCACPSGFGGVRCETHIATNFCQCENGGTCTSTGDCICSSGFSGPRCLSTSPLETHNSVCSSVVCSNGGTCVPNKQGRNTSPYSCTCSLGWSGEFCTVPVNICTTLPCANGGSCSPLPENKYKCECPRHFGGPDCSEPCDCENGGTCETANVCVCKDAFTGSKCQISRNQTYVTLSLQDSSVNEETLSASHVILVVCVSVATPLLVVVAVAVVLILKKRKRSEQKRNDELARKQNEQNTLHCVTKKCIDQHMIVNTFEDNGNGGSAMRTSNKCSNLDLSFKADHCQNTKNSKLGVSEFRNNSNSQLHNVMQEAVCSGSSTNSHLNVTESKADFYSAVQQQQSPNFPNPQYQQPPLGSAQPPLQPQATSQTSLLRSNPIRYSTYSYTLAPSSASSLHHHHLNPHHLSTTALRNSLLLNSASSAETSPASTCSSTFSSNNLNNNSPVINHSLDISNISSNSSSKNNNNNNNNLATEV